MKKQIICINCPIGCSLIVTLENGEATEVTGGQCLRGDAYARMECVNPLRVITSTVRLSDGGMLPVKTRDPVPKQLVMECVQALKDIEISPPVRVGDIVLADVCRTGVDFVATRSVARPVL
ncbi:MAG: DUF1667 domain-containing protein [Planctomycetes bacterium]|nr:DUF1667 domain-containing protein [Planctomycetota bacterium]